jgi:hypothetical protein
MIVAASGIAVGVLLSENILEIFFAQKVMIVLSGILHTMCTLVVNKIALNNNKALKKAPQVE